MPYLTANGTDLDAFCARVVLMISIIAERTANKVPNVVESGVGKMNVIVSGVGKTTSSSHSHVKPPEISLGEERNFITWRQKGKDYANRETP